MKDEEKLTNLLNEFGVKFDDYRPGEFIEIAIGEPPEPDVDDSNSKIRGQPWAGCSFYFDENGKFEFVELTGD